MLWNVMQSHPQVCSPIMETGQLLGQHILRRIPGTPIPLRNYRMFLRTPFCRMAGPRIRRQMFEWKMKNYEHPDNGTQYDGVPYKQDDVRQSVICLKSVNEDGVLTDFFDQLWDEVYFIGLVRNGYSVCNGFVRRGARAEEIGQRYASTVRRMLDYSKTMNNFTIVKFEDLLADPMGDSQRLYEFCGLEPVRLEKLRLKSKRVLAAEGPHQVRVGEEDHKYWMTRAELETFLDPNVNATQSSQLSDSDRVAFERSAGTLMKELGYCD